MGGRSPREPWPICNETTNYAWLPLKLLWNPNKGSREAAILIWSGCSNARQSMARTGAKRASNRHPRLREPSVCGGAASEDETERFRVRSLSVVAGLGVLPCSAAPFV